MSGEMIKIDIIDKKTWQINMMAIAIILALLLTLLVLQVFYSLGDHILESLDENFSQYFVSLALTVLLFCAYMIAQQKQVAHLTRALIEEKEVSQELSQNFRTLGALFKVSAGINSKREPQEILDSMAEEILSCLLADHTSVMLLDHESQTIRTRVSVGQSSDLVEQAALPIGEGVAGYVIDTGKPLLLNGEVGDEAFPGAPKKMRHICSSMCVPLRIADQNVGVLNVNRLEEPAPFSETDLNLVGVFANNAAGAIHNAILYKRIKSFNQDLEKKIAARTKDLEAANQIKSNFLSSVSHEMQTPLNAVVGFAKVLLTDSHGVLNPQQKKYTEHIAESGQRLSRIIQAMLDIASLTAGDFSTNVSPFHVHDLLESARQSHHAMLESKRITLQTGVCDALQAEKVVADAARLQQIVEQLISNAAKFSGENGKVKVSAELVQRSVGPSPEKSKTQGNAASMAKWLKVMIDDDGPGIAADHREKIFDLFYQAKSGIADKTSGIGVGLSMGSILAKLLGGSLTLCTNKAAPGSTFLLEVPVQTHS